MFSRSPSTRDAHASCKWDVIRYSLDSNARTARLCLILLVLFIPTLLTLLLWR